MPPEDADRGDPPTTAPCVKCETSISKTAKRCPECGYEPTNGILSKALYWLCTFPLTLLSTLFGLLLVIGVLVGELTFGLFVGAFVALVVFAAFPFWHANRYLERQQMTATGDIDESDMSEAAQLGGRLGEKLKSFVGR